MRRVVVVLAVALSSFACQSETPASPAQAQTGCFVEAQGAWQNERGSELRIDSVSAACEVKGSFRSVVGRVDTAVYYPVSGVARGDMVAFTVDFGGSLAAWVGQLDGETLRTQWHVSRDVPEQEEAQALWSSVLTGSDLFRRVR